ncbi:hypothetical protein P7L75_09470 [Tistrella mobilis]|uniref:hypothetical protein n=1 Tax=Tistrella mobilis TaxID=171437 RepID=UPI003558FF25
MTNPYDDAPKAFKRAHRLAKETGGDLFICGLDPRITNPPRAVTYAYASPLACARYAFVLMQVALERTASDDNPLDTAVADAIREALAHMKGLAAVMERQASACDAEGRGNVH